MKKKIGWIWFIFGGVAALAIGSIFLLVAVNAQAESLPIQSATHEGIKWSPDSISPLVIPAADFVNDGLENSYFYSFSAGSIGGTDCWEAPVYLPDGARILQYNASIDDTDAVGDFSVYFRRKYNGPGAGATQLLGTIDSSGSGGYVTYGDFTIDYPLVDYPGYSYMMTACGFSANTRLISLRVYYYIQYTYLPGIQKR